MAVSVVGADRAVHGTRVEACHGFVAHLVEEHERTREGTLLVVEGCNEIMDAEIGQTYTSFPEVHCPERLTVPIRSGRRRKPSVIRKGSSFVTNMAAEKSSSMIQESSRVMVWIPMRAVVGGRWNVELEIDVLTSIDTASAPDVSHRRRYQGWFRDPPPTGGANFETS